MHIAMVDGKVIFATHFINVDMNDEIRNNLTRFNLKDKGITCYSLDEHNQLIARLDELQLTYTVDELFHDLLLEDKSKNIKYHSRSEAINHLLDDIEPEHQKIPNLMKRLDQKERELSDTKLELDNMKQLFKQLDERMKKAKI